MHVLTKYVLSAVISSILAVILTVFVFQLSTADAVQTGLLASAVAVVIVYLNTRREESVSDGSA
ncbi:MULTISPECIES: hypothetical protein [Haloferax]|uniref:Uncharacterized protein n=2 Tax=Haloferax TaxID=2251 RepID=A0A6G1Z1P1_9EURY|nr:MULTISPECIES: hypothetical protein [Haloferax]KAB1187652.1 hypothetical protein Hfx1149_06245 [Haloferax sp. CBA1149]MRW80311.1 hypothetical protein [Haloferax marinisediminis]